jgi:Secretion system C-terminal sorting domain
LYKTKPKQTLIETEKFDVIIFPNPTTDGFNINVILGVVKDLQVTIVDMLGKELQKEEVILIDNKIYIKTKLISGAYLVKMKNRSNETMVKKLLVQ